jgi:hypothetical protein
MAGRCGGWDSGMSLLKRSSRSDEGLHAVTSRLAESWFGSVADLLICGRRGHSGLRPQAGQCEEGWLGLVVATDPEQL